jgi:hypothetical protein
MFLGSCHDGHDISFLAYGRSYCDCGACGCTLAAASEEAALEFRSANNDNPHVVFEEDGSGRIAGTEASGVRVPTLEVWKLVTNTMSALRIYSPRDQCEVRH